MKNIQGNTDELKLFENGVKVYHFYKLLGGYTCEHTWDANGNELTFKNSNGYSHEYTYDSKGRKLTYKNSKGINRNYQIRYMDKLIAIMAHLPDNVGITFIPDFDDAILGIELISMRLIYSKSRMLDICVDKLGLNDREAIPFIEDSMYSYRSTKGVVDLIPVVMDDIQSFM